MRPWCDALGKPLVSPFHETGKLNLRFICGQAGLWGVDGAADVGAASRRLAFLMR
jgi:hypothetical protein